MIDWKGVSVLCPGFDGWILLIVCVTITMTLRVLIAIQVQMWEKSKVYHGQCSTYIQ